MGGMLIKNAADERYPKAYQQKLGIDLSLDNIQSRTMCLISM
jgi:hypothetical protein